MKATIFISMLCLVLSIMTVSIMCLCKSIEINKSLDVATKTDGLVYLGIGKVRRMTASQMRYKRYKELRDVYDFENFGHFLKWDTLRRRSVRRWGES